MSRAHPHLKIVESGNRRSEVKSVSARFSFRRDRGLPGRSREFRLTESQLHELLSAAEHCGAAMLNMIIISALALVFALEIRWICR